ncbi:hypothetical protein ACFQPA_11375 [Halomarina halobia]|uniref:Uncharacterized protein n=1 Tax=Halomarina halobia TaxID=3033386 RepID=A0ABD6AA63_9EURY|nr:hypothetical protein [Halomarina sp. PSR21]
MDRDELDRALATAFDPSPGERRVVARQAVDLGDSGRYESDVGAPLSPDAVVANLRDAPDGRLPERWNWWIGSLELAFGGYAEFRVRRFPDWEALR